MKNDPCSRGKAEILHEILAYLVEHPDAQDTLEGITQWWLLERKIKHQSALVKEALGDLVRDGFVVERTLQDSLMCYLLNQGKRGEIEEFLRKYSR